MTLPASVTFKERSGLHLGDDADNGVISMPEITFFVNMIQNANAQIN